jgi:hypothetical protein
MAMTASSKSSSSVSEDAAVKAYVYTYPLVSVEVTRRQSTNLPERSAWLFSLHAVSAR